MIQIQRDKLDGELTIEEFVHSDDLFFNNLYIYIDDNDDIYLIDSSQGKVYDLPYYSYASHNVLLDCVDDLNNKKVVKCKRLKHIEKEILKEFYRED
jgi:hypothetical protein